MKVTRRFILFLVLGILAVHVASGWLRVRREVTLLHEDTAREEKVLGRALAHEVERTWTSHGEQEAIAVIEHATEREAHVTIRWVWLDAQPGDPYAPAAPAAPLEPLNEGQSAVLRLGTGDGALYSYVPLSIPTSRAAAIEISNPLGDELAYLRQSILNATMSALVLVVFCAALAWAFGVTLIGRPVRALVEQARRIGREDFSQELNLDSKDELGELATEMNRMCDALRQARERVAVETRVKIAAVEQLRHADRLTTVGTLASGMAHELGTPINVIDGRAKLIREDPAATDAARTNAQSIARQCKRMEKIIRGLLDFARRGHSLEAGAQLDQVVRETLHMIEPLAHGQGVITKATYKAGSSAARIDPAHLQQVVTNVVINGLQAMPEGGSLSLETGQVWADPPDKSQAGIYAFVCVEDTGVGMDQEVAARIFEPFFTTKDVGEGTGLGLSVAYGIVRDYGGWIGVESKPGDGSRFSVYLPLGEAA